MKKRSYELLIANRKYKDTIFRWIFSRIENLLSLYNAVTGKHYQNPEELEIVTIRSERVWSRRTAIYRRLAGKNWICNVCCFHIYRKCCVDKCRNC